ncbi:hypothetical protein DAT35_23375 [Vitiosangium sp. GDMCC 1.1324]|nr:hypothetical protein DAT35_23375 [Vitiosangium sp. GDMCC 1.1324]
MREERFSTAVEAGHMGWVYIRIPFDPSVTWDARSRHFVRGRLNGGSAPLRPHPASARARQPHRRAHVSVQPLRGVEEHNLLEKLQLPGRAQAMRRVRDAPWLAPSAPGRKQGA